MKKAIVLGLWVSIAVFLGVTVAFMTMDPVHKSNPTIEWTNTHKE